MSCLGNEVLVMDRGNGRKGERSIQLCQKFSRCVALRHNVPALLECGKVTGNVMTGNASSAEASATVGALDELRRAQPNLRLLTAAADLEHYGRDWTRRWTPAPLAIALPATIAEVQAIARWA